MAAGKKTGGRKKGTKNVRTRVKLQEVAEAVAAGLTPLDVMLRTMRDHAEHGRWDQASAVAKNAAPYMHPHLTSVAGDPDKPQIHKVMIGWEK